MAEKIFKTAMKNLIIVYKPGKKTIVEGEVVTIPAQQIEFKQGTFQTSDAKLIGIIKEHQFFKSKKIIEFDPEAEKKLKQEHEIGKEVSVLMKKMGLSIDDIKAKIKGNNISDRNNRIANSFNKENNEPEEDTEELNDTLDNSKDEENLKADKQPQETPPQNSNNTRFNNK